MLLSSSRFQTAQTGMVLLLCLIFLTSLTLLGLSATADTILQNQLSANLQEKERANQSAWASLAWAENWLLELEGRAPETCAPSCGGLYLHSAGNLPPHPEFETFGWWTAQGHQAGINPVTGEQMQTFSGSSHNPPVWVIEAVHSIPAEKNSTGQLWVWYRILARGSGHTASAVSVVESILARPWPSGSAPVLPGSNDPETCSDDASSNICGRVSWRELR